MKMEELKRKYKSERRHNYSQPKPKPVKQKKDSDLIKRLTQKYAEELEEKPEKPEQPVQNKYKSQTRFNKMVLHNINEEGSSAEEDSIYCLNKTQEIAAADLSFNNDTVKQPEVVSNDQIYTVNSNPSPQK